MFKNIVDKLISNKDKDYIYEMPLSSVNKESSILQMLPITIFTAIVILIVRMHVYTRPMSQFFWTTETDTENLTDFFSFNKMVLIVVCAVLALLLLCYSLASQSLKIRNTSIYIPMAIYSLFVLISYFNSDYKEFALWGWNDRFEGTITLLCYMLLLFYTINTVDSERNVKAILYPIAISTVLLSLLGLSQGLDIDFFRTVIGQKLIVPNWTLEGGSTTWAQIDEAAKNGELYLQFTFNNKEIYQTVYNINYVSFYLTLLIPIFGMLFILECKKPDGKALKKMGLGILFALIIYNFIGSASSGGVIGIGIIGLLGIIVLNKQLKNILKPLIVLFLIIALVMGITYSRWSSELKSTFEGIFPSTANEETDNETEEERPAAIDVDAKKTGEENFVYDLDNAGQTKPTIDYIDTTDDTITISINGNPLGVTVLPDSGRVVAFDKDNNTIQLIVIEREYNYFGFGDSRFFNYVSMVITDDGTYNYIILYTAGTQWNFRITDDGILYYNQLGKLVALHNVPRLGFINNQGFGSGRGNIWSASNPLLFKYWLVGAGADCFCAVFPQNDYTARFNIGYTQNLIVDKPHNMYLMMGIGTGGISLLSILCLFAIYIVQSFKTYFKREFDLDYLTYVGFGTFCGTTAFMFTGLVDDSTVSTMPMFYGLLGMGIAINLILQKRDKEKALELEAIEE